MTATLLWCVHLVLFEKMPKSRKNDHDRGLSDPCERRVVVNAAMKPQAAP